MSHSTKQKRRRIGIGVRRLVYAKTGGLCFYCWEALDFTWDFVCDHYIPISQGGFDDHSNLVPACIFCDQRKGNRMPTPAIFEQLKKWKRGYFKSNPAPPLEPGECNVSADDDEWNQAVLKGRQINRRNASAQMIAPPLPNPIIVPDLKDTSSI